LQLVQVAHVRALGVDAAVQLFDEVPGLLEVLLGTHGHR
jgi:hypothetical protein